MVAVASAALPGFFAIPQRKGRMPTALAIAIGVSAAAHIAAGLYLYNARFDPRFDFEPDPAMITEIINLPRPPKVEPPKTPERQPERRLVEPRRTNIPADATVTTTLPLDPVDEPIKAEDPTGGLTTSTGPTEHIAPPRDPVIRNPDWRSKPTGAQLAAAYPDRAARMGEGGRAVINCAVSANGRLRDCNVASETPADQEFGKAALKLSRYFQLSPRTVDGQAVDGARINIPIVFQTAE